MRLVRDQAADTVFGFRDLAIGRTPNHARVNVRTVECATEQRARIAIVAHIPVNRSAFEVLSATGTRADHIRAASVNDRHIK